MALSTFKRNRLPPLHFKALIININISIIIINITNNLPPTLRVSYQFNPSSSPSSSSSSYSDLKPLVDLSRAVFYFFLKLSFSQSLSLHSRLSLPQTDLLKL